MVKKLVKKSEFAKLAGVSGAAVTKACKPGGSLAKALEGKRIDAAHPVAAAYIAEKTGTVELTSDVAPTLIMDKKTAAQLGLGPSTKKKAATKKTKSKTVVKPEPNEDPLLATAAKLYKETGRTGVTFYQQNLKVGYNRAVRIRDAVLADAPPRPPRQPAPPPPTTNPEDELLEIPEDIQAFADMTLRQLVEKFGTATRFLDWLNATKRIEDINEKRLKNAQTRGELVSRQLVKVGILDPVDTAHRKLLTDGAKTIARRVTAKNAAGDSLESVEEFVVDQLSSFIRPMKAQVSRIVKRIDKAAEGG